MSFGIAKRLTEIIFVIGGELFLLVVGLFFAAELGEEEDWAFCEVFGFRDCEGASVEAEIVDVSFELQAGFTAADAKRRGGVDGIAQRIFFDVKREWFAVEINFYTRGFAGAVVRGEQVLPGAGRNFFFGDDFDGVGVPLVDEMDPGFVVVDLCPYGALNASGGERAQPDA